MASVAVSARDAAARVLPRGRGERQPWGAIAAFLLPAFTVYTALTAYPVLRTFWNSFHKVLPRAETFVGLDNYAALVTDPYLWTVVVRSVVFCVVTALVTVAIGGAMAVLMNALTTWARVVLQVALLVAWAMPVVAAMTVWIWIVDWRRGLLNWALVKLGVDGAEGHNWLAEPLSFFVVASVIIVWMSVPFVALSIYAGLTQVSSEVLEAASLDGATGIQRLRHIIVPIIAPVLSIVMLLQLIWDLRVFTQIKLLQDAGGVTNETNLLGTYVYQLGTGKGDFGTASAVSILILALTVALSAYYVRSLMKEDV